LPLLRPLAAPAPAARTFRPFLESLEARALPSVTSLSPTVNVSRMPGAQSEVGIAVNPTNPLNLVAVANDISDLGHIGAWVSFDGGSTWQPRFIDAGIDHLTEDEARFDPNVAFDSHGRCYVLYSVGGGDPGSRLMLARSSDG